MGIFRKMTDEEYLRKIREEGTFLDNERKKERKKKIKKARNVVSLLTAFMIAFGIASKIPKKDSPKKSGFEAKTVSISSYNSNSDKINAEIKNQIKHIKDTTYSNIQKHSLPSDVKTYMEREKKYDKFICKYSSIYKIPKEWIIAILSNESSMGYSSDNLGQITPIAQSEIKNHEKEIEKKYGISIDPNKVDDPENNIAMTAWLISNYRDKINSTLNKYKYRVGKDEEFKLTALSYRYGISIVDNCIEKILSKKNHPANLSDAVKNYLENNYHGVRGEGYDKKAERISNLVGKILNNEN